MAKKKVDDPSLVANASFNMTPMIDVTFQLIVVFLCSMKFRTLDQKIEAFLPKDVGMAQTPSTSSEAEVKVVVKLARKPGQEVTSVRLLENPVGTTATTAVWKTLQGRLGEFVGKDEKIKGEIDADADVPHGEVMAALDSFMAVHLTNVVFKGTQLNKSGTLGRPQPKR